MGPKECLPQTTSWSFSRFCTVKPSWAAWQTDWRADWQTPRTSTTVVCISCIRWSPAISTGHFSGNHSHLIPPSPGKLERVASGFHDCTLSPTHTQLNYVTSAARCRQPRSSLWWSPWCYPGWITETPYCWSSGLYLVRRLQSVLYAAAQLIYCMRSADHITDALACLHWLRVPERIDFKVAVLTYKVLHGSAPRYLGPLVPVANPPGRRTLRSGGTSRLIVPSVRRSTVFDRAFSVAGPRVWNTLQSLLTLRQQLKTWLFKKSYPDIIMWTRISLNFTINLGVVLLLRQFSDWFSDWLATQFEAQRRRQRHLKL